MADFSIPLRLTGALFLLALSCTGARVGADGDGATLPDSTCYEVFGMD